MKKFLILSSLLFILLMPLGVNAVQSFLTFYVNVMNYGTVLMLENQSNVLTIYEIPSSFSSVPSFQGVQTTGKALEAVENVTLTSGEVALVHEYGVSGFSTQNFLYQYVNVPGIVTYSNFTTSYYSSSTLSVIPDQGYQLQFTPWFGIQNQPVDSVESTSWKVLPYWENGELVVNSTGASDSGQYVAWKYSPISNVINVTIHVTSFPTRAGNPGISVYSPNIGDQTTDNNNGFYALLVDFYDNGIWFHSPTSNWGEIYGSLPQPNPNYPFTFTAILTENSAGNITVSTVYINGTAYSVNVNTPFPWSQIGYVAIRGDIGNIFYVSYFGVSPAPYDGSIEQFVNNVESTCWNVLPYWENGQLVINTYYVSVTVSNSQSIATPAPFDQFLNITESQIASALGSTSASQLWQKAMSDYFLNLLFQQNGQTLYAWVQNYTSSWVAVWVKLPNGIPASSSVTINIYFTNSIQYPYTGVNPLLTPSYGQYDNGQNVFLFYNNFASPSSLTNFKVINGTNPSLATVTFNDGFNLTAQATGTYNWYFLNSTVSFSEPVMAYADINVNLFGSTSNPIYLRTAYPMLTDNLTTTGLENTWSDSVAISINGNGNQPWAFFATNDSGNAYQYNTGIQGSVSEFWGVGYGYSTSVGYFYEHLLSTTYTINYAPRANHPMSLVLGFAGTPSAKFSIKTFYVFVAPLPPNNIMPSITAVTSSSGVAGQYIAWKYSPISNVINITIHITSYPSGIHSSPGIVVYSPNIGDQTSDNNVNNFQGLLVTFDNGGIFYHSTTSGYASLKSSAFPTPSTSYPFTMSVILTENSAGNITVSTVYINGTAYSINVNTPFPWSQIAYIGIRGDQCNIFYVSYFAVSPFQYGIVKYTINSISLPSMSDTSSTTVLISQLSNGSYAILGVYNGTWHELNLPFTNPNGKFTVTFNEVGPVNITLKSSNVLSYGALFSPGNGVLLEAQNAIPPSNPTNYEPLGYVGTNGEVGGGADWASPQFTPATLNSINYYQGGTIATTDWGTTNFTYYAVSVGQNLPPSENYVTVGTGFTSNWADAPSGYYSFQNGFIDMVYIENNSIATSQTPPSVSSMLFFFDPTYITQQGQYINPFTNQTYQLTGSLTREVNDIGVITFLDPSVKNPVIYIPPFTEVIVRNSSSSQIFINYETFPYQTATVSPGNYQITIILLYTAYSFVLINWQGWNVTIYENGQPMIVNDPITQQIQPFDTQGLLSAQIVANPNTKVLTIYLQPLSSGVGSYSPKEIAFPKPAPQLILPLTQSTPFSLSTLTVSGIVTVAMILAVVIALARANQDLLGSIAAGGAIVAVVGIIIHLMPVIFIGSVLVIISTTYRFARRNSQS